MNLVVEGFYLLFSLEICKRLLTICINILTILINFFKASTQEESLLLMSTTSFLYCVGIAPRPQCRYASRWLAKKSKQAIPPPHRDCLFRADLHPVHKLRTATITQSPALLPGARPGNSTVTFPPGHSETRQNVPEFIAIIAL